MLYSSSFFSSLLFISLLFSLARAKQQCRLVNNLNAQLGDPDPQAPLSATATSATASATASAFPTIAPFNYGTDVIRGVNL